MPEFIALDWETSQLNGLHAEVSSSGVRVQQCFCLSWPAEIDAIAEPPAAGKWFQAELKRLGIRSRQVLVSLPRDDTVVRQLDLPDVPDDELPDLVRLQAETKTSSSLDRLVLDFLPLPRSADAASRQVLMVTIAREAIDRIRETVESAGLELVSIGINPASTAELVTRVERRRGASADETSLTVTRHGRRVEIELLRDRHLLFTHSMQLTGEDDLEDTRLVLAEVRRSLGALSRIDSTVAVTRAWVIGTETEDRSLCRSLREQLTCDVGIIDPLSDECISADSVAEFPGSHAPFAGPLGMLLATAEPTVEAVDFLRPRKPVIRPDRRKLKAGLVAAGVLCAVAAWYGGVKLRVNSLESEIAEKRQQLSRLEEAIKKDQPTLKSAGLIDDWEMRNVDWLSRMQQLSKILPGTDRIYLANYKFSPAAGALAARIEATGFARSRRDAEQLYQRLAENYRVQPHEISRTSNDADYPYHFRLDLALTSADAEKPESP